jgi:hypothetical protein
LLLLSSVLELSKVLQDFFNRVLSSPLVRIGNAQTDCGGVVGNGYLVGGTVADDEKTSLWQWNSSSMRSASRTAIRKQRQQAKKGPMMVAAAVAVPFSNTDFTLTLSKALRLC